MDAKSSIKVACPACQTTKVSFLWLLVAMLFIFSPIAKGDCVVIDVLGGDLTVKMGMGAEGPDAR